MVLADTQEAFAAMKQLFVGFLLLFSSFFAQAQNRGLPDFTELVEKQGGAVVNISTIQSARNSARGAQPFPFDAARSLSRSTRTTRCSSFFAVSYRASREFREHRATSRAVRSARGSLSVPMATF